MRSNFSLAILLFSLAASAAWCADPAQKSEESCVILKRMGPADEVTSHLYSFGNQFQFVEGQLLKGVKFHGRLTDHDVRGIEEDGGRVIILDAHYTDPSLRDARASCSGK